MTPFGIHRDSANHVLARQAVREALHDAGVDNSDQLGSVSGHRGLDVAFFASATHGYLQGQAMISGEIALRGMGIQGIPVYNVENACASGASTFALAVTQVRAGEADTALAVGADKMHIGDATRTMSLFDTAYDVSDRAALDRTLEELGGVVDEPELGRWSIFMDIYAAMARSHMRQFGTTAEQIAAVAAKTGRGRPDRACRERRRISPREEAVTSVVLLEGGTSLV